MSNRRLSGAQIRKTEMPPHGEVTLEEKALGRGEKKNECQDEVIRKDDHRAAGGGLDYARREATLQNDREGKNNP